MLTGTSPAVLADRVVVVALGNPDRSDDGVGPAVIRALEPRPNVEVWEAIKGGLPLAHALVGFPRALIVDAAPFLPVGEVALFPLIPTLSHGGERGRGETLPRSRGGPGAGWPHGLGLARALAALRAAGLDIPEAWALGIGIPPDPPFRRGLSPEVRRAVPRAVAEVRRWLMS
ncbi:MAG: hydrogenase maturation protease [Candidatus Acetothermia bacterium]|jgi:hydrogenase maturation protease|nr:hydrogenase maturation protease [Candidatus Acetothermia bacterium]